MAEGEGFEPSEPLGSLVFKAITAQVKKRISPTSKHNPNSPARTPRVLVCASQWLGFRRTARMLGRIEPERADGVPKGRHGAAGALAFLAHMTPGSESLRTFEEDGGSACVR